MSNFIYYLAFNRMVAVGPRTVMKLLKLWPNLADCFNLTEAALLEAGLPVSLAQQIVKFDWDSIQADLEFVKQPNQHILTWDHPQYPSLLKEIYDPPTVLYAVGQLDCLHQTQLAVIGTRNPSHAGRGIAFEWAQSLSKAGLTIVSGLARGIDTAAHEGCMLGSGKTVGVLGTGVNVIYPSSNQHLAHKMTQAGLLLSEFPLNFPPKAGHFPRRNRIISGLAVATLVIEASLKSGSLITARYALEQNRDVFALPGSIYLPQAQGCHHLLKQGATLMTCYQDVLTELGLTQPSGVSSLTEMSNTPDPVLNCLTMEPAHINTIMRQTGLPLDKLTSRLIELELAGKVMVVQGGYIRPHPSHS